MCIHSLPNIKARDLNDNLNIAIHKNTNQYGEPMKDFLLANVAVIWADTPKSAIFFAQTRNISTPYAHLQSP